MSFQNPPGGFGPPGTPPPGGQPPGFGGPPGYGGPPPGGQPPGFGGQPPGFGAPGGQPGYTPPPGYGAPAPGVAPQFSGPTGAKTELMAIISLVAGILSIPAWYCCYAGLPVGIAAIILGIISIIKINKEPDKWSGKGLAFGGIAAAALGIVIFIGIFVLYGAALFMMKP